MNTAVHNSVLLQLFARVYFAIQHKPKLAMPALRILTALIGKKPLNIILADDDKDDQEIFLEAMQEIAPHVQVTVCGDGNQLMNTLFKKGSILPDLIFLDLNMPLKSGDQCLRDIRQSEELRGIPVIIYSTSRHEAHIEKTFLNGANFYFPKPHSFDDLKAVMQKIFNFHWNEFLRPDKAKFVLNINRLDN
jgi:CheY-like chemotaxis protein